MKKQAGRLERKTQGLDSIGIPGIGAGRRSARGVWALMRAQPAQAADLSDAARDKILKYIRERFGVPDTVKLSLSAPHASTMASDFDEATVTVDNGTKQALQPVLISKDSRYLIVIPPNGNIELHQNTSAEMAQRVREAFGIEPDTKISVTGFKRSPSPDFQEGTLTVDNGKQPKRDNTVLLSRDGKHLIVSEILNLTVDPGSKPCAPSRCTTKPRRDRRTPRDHCRVR